VQDTEQFAGPMFQLLVTAADKVFPMFRVAAGTVVSAVAI
jgi:hypothetical protein